MKFVLYLRSWAIASLLAFSLYAHGGALDRWQWRNPLPTGNSLFGVAFGEDRFVAVGALGATFLSSNGVNYSAQSSVSTQRLNAVTFGGGQFVAVGNGGVIQTSPDGGAWTLQNSGTSFALLAVAYGSGKFVAVGENGITVSSPNGVTWSAGVSGTSATLTGIAFGSGLFVAIGPYDTVFRSSDGLSWTPQTLKDRNFTIHSAITYGNGQFLIGSSHLLLPYSETVFTSSNGTSWTTNSVPDFNGVFRFVAFGNGIYIAVVSEINPRVPVTPQLLTSINGRDWTPVTASIADEAVAFGNGLFVTVGPRGAVYTSLDGVTWAPGPGRNGGSLTGIAVSGSTNVVVGGVIPTGVYVQDVTVLRSVNGSDYSLQTAGTGFKKLGNVAFEGGVFVAVGEQGTILRSPDGITWTPRSSGTVNTLHSLVARPGLFVAVGDQGTIQTSPNGMVWTGRSSGTGYNLYGITYGAGSFVAVGFGGVVLTSPDGSSWVVQDSGSLTNLFDVTYGANGFVIVGAGGVVIRSVDGINWVSGSSGTTLDLYGVSSGGDHYLAVGGKADAPVYSVIISSTNGVSWVRHDPPFDAPTPLFKSAFVNGRFLVLGGYGTILESDSLVPPLALQARATPGEIHLEVSAIPGSSFRVLGSTNLLTSGWQEIAVFTNASAVTSFNDATTNRSQRFYRIVSP